MVTWAGPTPRRPWPAAAAAGVALLAAGCVGPAAPGASHAPPVARSAPAASTPARPPATLAAADLTGFGATEAAWAAGHHRDPAGPPTSYWPRLPDGADTYTAVAFPGGRARSYTEHLDPPVSVHAALAVIGDELPPDAHVVTEGPGPGGEAVVEASPTLRAATGDRVEVVLHGPGGGSAPREVATLVYRALPAPPE